MDAAVKRKSIDVPKPEAGLAEWTSKIRALQRQVDADEEVEQKKLEEEIRASRLARSRRSTGMMQASDLANSAYGRTLRELEPQDQTTTPTDNRSDALRRLEGGGGRTAEPDTYSPTIDHSSITSPRMARLNSAPGPGPSKQEPVSLAAFIGGRATGPRLNKVAPQVDAHDPTLFDQRPRGSEPHPVFGRGGVAMPGLVAKGRMPSPAVPAEDLVTPRVGVVTTPTGLIPRTFRSVPLNDSPKTPRDSPKPNFGERSRTISTPSPVDAALRVSQASPSPTPTSNTPARPNKPDALRRISYSGSSREDTPSKSPVDPVRTFTTTSPPIVQKPTISVPSLATVVQPQVRPNATGSFVPSTGSPSPAFLKAPSQKDQTPSISRLQGRGFVQSFVKKSDQLQATVTGSPVTPDRSPSGKKSVLERWQPPASGAQSPSPVHSHSSSISRTRSRDRSDESSSSSGAFGSGRQEMHTQARPALKMASSLPHISQVKPPPEVDENIAPPSPGEKDGVGSSNTLISYIKPNKTGEDPDADNNATIRSTSTHKSRSVHQAGDVDELGRRTTEHGVDYRKASKAKSDVSSSSSSPGRPLSHPTKDRAKKPRKGTGSQARLTQMSNFSEPPRQKTPEPEPQQRSVVNVNVTKAAERTVDANPPVLVTTSLIRRQESLPTPSSPIDSTNANANRVQQLRKSWSDLSLIDVKPVTKPPTFPVVSRMGLDELDMAGLPPTPPLTVRAETRSPQSPRHTRIPSTGTRATVMDVAQALKEKLIESPTKPEFPRTELAQTVIEKEPEDDEDDSEDEDIVPQIDVKAQIANWGKTITPASYQAERRKSSYDRYSSIMMPPLHEEKTPVPSPAGTLSRSNDLGSVVLSGLPVVEDFSAQLPRQSEPTQVPDMRLTFHHNDGPVPPFEIKGVHETRLHVYQPDPDLRKISVEVLNLAGNVANAVPEDNLVFYDAELLAVIYRVKSKSSGLALTKMWSWRGAKSEAGDKEETKLQDLSKRFNTTLQRLDQFHETEEFLDVLGGTLAVRQGKRTLWSADNTTMHVVRSWNGFNLIDEVDLNIRNLCSGFSYCVSVLDTLWVWHGRGSTPSQREAANIYSRGFADSGKVVVEVEEGKEDEMFWMFLGDDGYASADYWRWKTSDKAVDGVPRIWVMNTADTSNPVKELSTFRFDHKSVYLTDLGYELFVLVGSEARSRRVDIRLALTVAKALASHVAPTRPFTPSVHALILPSLLPLDLAAAIRGLSEAGVNPAQTPEHMNIVPLDKAFKHLDANAWDEDDLADTSMLPIGLGPADISH